MSKINFINKQGVKEEISLYDEGTIRNNTTFNKLLKVRTTEGERVAVLRTNPSNLKIGDYYVQNKANILITDYYSYLTQDTTINLDPNIEYFFEMTGGNGEEKLARFYTTANFGVVIEPTESGSGGNGVYASFRRNGAHCAWCCAGGGGGSCGIYYSANLDPHSYKKIFTEPSPRKSYGGQGIFKIKNTDQVFFKRLLGGTGGNHVGNEVIKNYGNKYINAGLGCGGGGGGGGVSPTYFNNFTATNYGEVYGEVQLGNKLDIRLDAYYDSNFIYQQNPTNAFGGTGAFAGCESYNNNLGANFNSDGCFSYAGIGSDGRFGFTNYSLQYQLISSGVGNTSSIDPLIKIYHYI